MATRLITLKEAARRLRSTVSEVERRLCDRDAELFELDGAIAIREAELDASLKGHPPLVTEWARELDELAHRAARGSGPISAVDLIHEERADAEKKFWRPDS